ncbi:MAG: hypothetical protein ACLQU2_36120 [Candidatus Binataceae bacterium]
MDEKGGLEREILTKCWPLPDNIEVRENRLWYSFGQAPELAKLGQGFLSDFLKIADASPNDLPKAVKRYATRYGVLELCEKHLLPRSHPNYADVRYPPTLGAEFYGYCPPRQEGKRFCERLSEWRYWSRQALALVNLAGNAKRGQLSPRKEIRFLLPTMPREALEIQGALENPDLTPKEKSTLIARVAAILGDDLPQSPGDQWKIVARIVNLWLTLGRPQPICTVENSEPTIILAPGLECGWLFTMLSIQLMVAVTGAKALECCTNCRSFYLPKKLASTGTRRFCPKCGIRAARRFAQADFRKRYGG